MSRAAKRRVALLCEVSLELERLGPMYLAMLLVQETYAREMLEQCVFGKASVDAAHQATLARLRKALARPGFTPRIDARQERHARRLKGILDLGERMKLRAAGQPLPDARRRAKKAA